MRTLLLAALPLSLLMACPVLDEVEGEDDDAADGDDGGDCTEDSDGDGVVDGDCDDEDVERDDDSDEDCGEDYDGDGIPDEDCEDGDRDEDEDDGERGEDDGTDSDGDGIPDDEEGSRDDDGGSDDLLTWQELRTVETDWGCSFEIRGEGVQVSDRELAALCPDCDAIFEISTDIDEACADTGTTIQVVNPYYRGLVGWGERAVDVYMITQAPHYDVEDAYLLAEDVDATGGGRMSYSYSGDLGVEDGGYTVDAVFIVD